MHILQQYGKGYITGVNTNRWKKHVANTRLTFAKMSVYYKSHQNISRQPYIFF